MTLLAFMQLVIVLNCLARIVISLPLHRQSNFVNDNTAFLLHRTYVQTTTLKDDNKSQASISRGNFAAVGSKNKNKKRYRVLKVLYMGR